MKKILKSFIIIIIVTTNYKVFCQNSNGIVTYKASLWSQEKLNTDTLKINSTAKQALNKLMRNENKLEYKLKFNKKYSLFKKVNKIEDKKNTLLKIYIGKGEFYYDKKNEVSINMKETYGDGYLISYPKNKWTITNETKKINNYLCRKAITKKINSKTQKEDIIIAWFTVKIPINYGPTQFSGLPGLIIELDYVGKYNLKAIKVELNLKEEIEIKLPEKGIKISVKEYEQMLKNIFDSRRKKFNRRKR